MIRTKFVYAHMEVAQVYAKLSTCERLKVGAVIVKGDTPIAIGYNGTKPGQDNCCEDENGRTKPGVRHAEINALNKLWTSKESAEGSVMFQTHAPCLDCAQDVFNAGIVQVYYANEYTSREGKCHGEGKEFLLKNGVDVFKVIDYKICKLGLALDGSIVYNLLYENSKTPEQKTTNPPRSVESDSTETQFHSTVFFKEGGIIHPSEKNNLYSTAKIPTGDAGHIQPASKGFILDGVYYYVGADGTWWHIALRC